MRVVKFRVRQEYDGVLDSNIAQGDEVSDFKRLWKRVKEPVADSAE